MRQRMQQSQLAAQPHRNPLDQRLADVCVRSVRPLVQDPQRPVTSCGPTRSHQAQNVPRVRYDVQDFVPSEASLAHAPLQHSALHMRTMRHDVRQKRQAEAARGQTRQPPALRVQTMRQGLLPQGASQRPRDFQTLQTVSV